MYHCMFKHLFALKFNFSLSSFHLFFFRFVFQRISATIIILFDVEVLTIQQCNWMRPYTPHMDDNVCVPSFTNKIVCFIFKWVFFSLSVHFYNVYILNVHLCRLSDSIYVHSIVFISFALYCCCDSFKLHSVHQFQSNIIIFQYQASQ